MKSAISAEGLSEGSRLADPAVRTALLEGGAKARFAVYGKANYPDATFTLRLSYGAVEIYPENGTLAQPFTTFSSNDIIGGNSGSPVVDRMGELAGLVFDGNIESMPGRFYFDPRCNRTVAVDARAIVEAPAKVFDAKSLVLEITGK